MMRKRIFYLLVIPFLIFLTNCQSVYRQTIQANNIQPEIRLPEITLEMPQMSLDHLFDVSIAEEIDFSMNRMDITDVFSPADVYEFDAKDPKLFASENEILIDLTRTRKEEYAFPLPGAKLISEYAGRRTRHTGVDLKVARRDTIVSAFDGIVRIARRNATYGNVIVIRHYNGLETLYSHNTQNFVKVGDRVKAGQPIATSGQTGRASTDHLHFETRINGQHFNPALVFNFETQELQNKGLLCVKNGNKVSINHIDLFPYTTAYNQPADDPVVN